MWKTEHSVETTASPSSVWGLLADADGWPSWNPGLASAHLDGPLRNGTTGQTIQASGQKGNFTVTDVQDGARFVNEAKVPGALLRFQQGNAAVGAIAVSLAICASASRANLSARAFRFRSHFHGFFHALLQGELLHGPEHTSLGLNEQ